jgi:hypothetical protein
MCCLSVDDGGGEMCGDNRSVVLMVAEVPQVIQQPAIPCWPDKESTKQTDK